jgi:hypothetical protein
MRLLRITFPFAPEGLGVKWNSKAVATIFLFGSLFYLLAGRFWPIDHSVSALPRLDSAEPAGNVGFIPNGVYPTTPALGGHLKTYGSWVGSDASTGRMATPWYVPANRFSLFIAGYPAKKGNSLSAELEFHNGTRKLIGIELPDSAENWRLRTVDLGGIGDAVKMRILAADQSTEPAGWFGFSELGKASPAIVQSLDPLIRILLTAIISITFLIGPGLVLRSLLSRVDVTLPSILMLMPGALLLAFWGLCLWVTRFHQIATPLFPTALLVLAAIAFGSLRWDAESFLTAGERKVLIFVLLVIAVASGKGLYSLGPVGELFEGFVSRSTEVGGRSDSRTSFHIVQMIDKGWPLSSQIARDRLFEPFFPTSRGPLAGMAAAPIVLLSGPKIPEAQMNQLWEPFDAYGFTAFRVFTVCLSASTLFVFYGLALVLSKSERLALFGVALLAISPFFVHEVYFTWPKPFTSAIILIAFYFALKGEDALAGLSLGLAFLSHPMALLSLAPLTFLILAVQTRAVLGQCAWRDAPLRRKVFAALVAMCRTVGPAAICILVLFVWNKSSVWPDQGSTFFSFLISANGVVCHTLGEWLQDRLVSLLATLAPFYLFAVSANDPRVNSIGGPSPAVVRFYFSYWNTVPFAVGIVLFFPFVAWIAGLARRYAVVFLALVAAPFLIFLVYWGFNHSGLMPEGLHLWYLTLFLFLVWGIAGSPELESRVAIFAGRVWYLRALELLGMLLAPTFFTRWRVIHGRYAVTDLAALGMMIGGTALLAWATRLIFAVRREPLPAER